MLPKNQTSLFWDSAFDKGSDYPLMNIILLDRIFEFFKNNNISVKNALDVGCGTGDLTRKLSHRGVSQVTGLDFSKVALDIAISKKEDLNIEYIHKDANEISKDYFNKTYDLITVKLSIAFLKNRESFLKTIKSTLSETGYLVIITPVLYEGIEYGERLKSISIPEKELILELKNNFKEVLKFHENFFEERGAELVVISSGIIK